MTILETIRTETKERINLILSNEKVMKITEPIIKFYNKTVEIIGRWKGIVLFLNIKKMHDDAFDWVAEITERGDASNSKNIPADLRQNNPKTILTRSGKLTSGYTLERDWNYGEDAGISQLYITTGILAMVVLNVLGITSLTSLGAVMPFMSGGISSMFALSGLGVFLLPLLVLVIVGFVQGNFSLLKLFFKFIAYFIAFVVLFSVINMNTNNALATAFAYSIPAFLMWYLSYTTDRKRAFELLLQAESHNGTLNENFITHDDSNNPKVVQYRKALEDTTPFIEIGVATGRMQRDGDDNAPDAGIEVGLTIKDSGQHIFIEGGTGTGKTWLLNSLLCRFYVYSLYENKKIGVFTADGKGELPYQLNSIQDAIIAPHLIKNLNFLTGLRPEQRINILLAANNDTENAGQNQIFKNGGIEVGFYAALTQDLLVEMKHLIDPSIEKISSSFNYWEVLANKILSAGVLNQKGECTSHVVIDLLKLHPSYGNNKSIDKVIAYINRMQKPDNRELVDSYLANFTGWTSQITQNTRLYDWADSETSDINIYDILKGKKYGIALKPEDFGIAGNIITQFVKASLFNRLALRDDGWRKDKEQTDVMIVLDECQDIVNSDDVDQAQKARSRGIILVYATQHKTNLENKLGEKGAEALLLSFMNNIQLRTGDEKSIEFMKHKLGKIRTVISSAAQGNPIDFVHTNQIMMRSPEFNSSHPEAHFIKFSGSKIKATSKFFGGLTKEGGRATTLRESQTLATYNYNPEQPMRDLMTPEIIKSLDVPHYAIVRVQRAGMPRNDVVKVYGMSSEDVAKTISVAKDQMIEKQVLSLKKAA